MNKQISLRLPEKLLKDVESRAKKDGYGTVQEYIAVALRDKIIDEKYGKLEKITKKQAMLIEKLIEVTDKKNLWLSEEEIRKTLRSRKSTE